MWRFAALAAFHRDDGARVRAAEEWRDRDQQAIIAERRRRGSWDIVVDEG